MCCQTLRISETEVLEMCDLEFHPSMSRKFKSNGAAGTTQIWLTTNFQCRMITLNPAHSRNAGPAVRGIMYNVY